MDQSNKEYIDGRIEELQSQINALRRDNEYLHAKIDTPVEKYYYNEGLFRITQLEIAAYRMDFDGKYIFEVIKLITTIYAEYYTDLPFALKQWLIKDRPEFKNENATLLANGLPPVSEQLRLFPDKAPKEASFFKPKDKDYIDPAAQEALWREQQGTTQEEIEKAKEVVAQNTQSGAKEQFEAKVKAAGFSSIEEYNQSKNIV